MAPWFFDLIGVDASGATFELVFWALCMAAAVGLGWRERVAGRALSETWVTWGVAILGGAFSAVAFARVATTDWLFFGAEGLMLPTYGVAMATGFGLGLYLTYRDVKRSPTGFMPVQIIDLAFVVMIAGLAGARILYMLTEVPVFVDLCTEGGDCLAALRFWEGGLVFYGGVIGGLLGGWWWCWKNDVDFFGAADASMPYLSLGHAIGRLGCIAVGCCFGRECPTEMGITYPPGSGAYDAHFAAADVAGQHALIEAGHSHPVYPVQLYESWGEWVIFVLLALLVRPRRRYVGQITVLWLAMYGMLRVITEVFRGDSVRGFVLELPIPAVNAWLGLPATEPILLSTSQLIGFAMMAAAAGLAVVLRRRAKAMG